MALYFRNKELLRETSPITRLWIPAATNAELKRLADDSDSKHLRSLEVRFPDQTSNPHDYDVTGVTALAESPYFRDLNALSLHSHQLGPETLNLICQCGTFKKLQRLELTGPRFNDYSGEPVVTLVQSGLLPDLRSLTLGEGTRPDDVLKYYRRNDPATFANRIR